MSFAPIFPTLKAASAVTALLANPPRCYPQGEAPQGVAKPYVVYQQITGSPENYLGGNPDIDGTTTQLDVYGDTLASCRNVYTACRNALQAIGYITSYREMGREPDTNLYRISFDLSAYINR